MAKLKKYEGIEYVQLFAADFLEDIDFVLMNAEERGVYVSVIIYLYCNGGLLKFVDSKSMAKLSNCFKLGNDWDVVWENIKHKFIIKSGVISHKRVTAELKKAAKFKKQKSLAGLASAQQRRDAARTALQQRSNTPSTNETKRKNSSSSSNTKDKSVFSASPFSSKTPTQHICDLLKVKSNNKSDITTLVDIFNQLESKNQDQPTINIFRRVVDVAQDCKTATKPVAAFVAAMKKPEFGYVPKRRR